MNEEEREQEPNLVFGTTETPRVESIIIPKCCVEGLDWCPHVAKPQRKIKQNVGL